MFIYFFFFVLHSVLLRVLRLASEFVPLKLVQLLEIFFSLFSLFSHTLSLFIVIHCSPPPSFFARSFSTVCCNLPINPTAVTLPSNSFLISAIVGRINGGGGLA